MQGHRLIAIRLPSTACTAACECSATFDAREPAQRRALHRDHVAEMKAREELTAALVRWEGDPAQLFLDVENVADWAERDQDEVRQCGDGPEVEREARNNMKIVRELATAFRALLILDGWKPVKTTAAA